jgi:Flp pilus assembly protein TadG
MAFVLPIFLAVLLCQFEASRIGMVSQLLTNAAREAARVAVIKGRTQAEVNARITQVLNGSGVSFEGLSAVNADPGTPGAYIMPTNWASSQAGTPVSVVLRVRFARVSWNPRTRNTTNPSATVASVVPMPNFANVEITGQATMNSERP